jgi:predicted metal-dependent enzyme (double-stranded beta helix superfamily)
MKAAAIAYKPVGLVIGAVSGAVAGALFRQAWKLVTDEDDAPDATDKDRSWQEILLAAAVQGAIFAVVKAAVDRSGAHVVQRVTGHWPD